jgi:D-alanyl-D-alanine carboxypeptidase/D-alanyl-D-alanine-endopeptidase (penicillin-binding protein 4)
MVDQQTREAVTARSDEASVVLHSEDSAPMHALLSLANTESHNFTAEVLMREAADAWDVNRAALATTRWMQAQGLPMTGLRVRDGSGLSRGNRLTSRSLSVLLWRMAQHPLGAYYQASMAIAGQRGTLRNYFRGTSLQGRFWGKTGTLTGVRSISGMLETADGPRYVSMISNGAYAPNSVMGQILLASQRVSRCPSWNAGGTPHGVRD